MVYGGVNLVPIAVPRICLRYRSCIYKYIYIYRNIYGRVCMCVCVCVCVCVCLCVCVCVYSNKQNITSISLHCLKGIRIHSYSGLIFPTFGLNTETYGTYAI